MQARVSAPPRFLPPDTPVTPSPSKRRSESASRIRLSENIPTTSKATLPVTTPKKPLSTSAVTPVKHAFAFNQLPSKKPLSNDGLKTTPIFKLETPGKRPMTPVKLPPPQLLESARMNSPHPKERTSISNTRIATVMDPSTEAGNLEVTTLFLDRLGYKGLAGPVPVRGLEVSPEKGSRRARKFVRYVNPNDAGPVPKSLRFHLGVARQNTRKRSIPGRRRAIRFGKPSYSLYPTPNRIFVSSHPRSSPQHLSLSCSEASPVTAAIAIRGRRG